MFGPAVGEAAHAAGDIRCYHATKPSPVFLGPRKEGIDADADISYDRRKGLLIHLMTRLR
jgi:hypothetical protein